MVEVNVESIPLRKTTHLSAAPLPRNNVSDTELPLNLHTQLHIWVTLRRKEAQLTISAKNTITKENKSQQSTLFHKHQQFMIFFAGEKSQTQLTLTSLQRALKSP